MKLNLICKLKNILCFVVGLYEFFMNCEDRIHIEVSALRTFPSFFEILWFFSHTIEMIWCLTSTTSNLCWLGIIATNTEYFNWISRLEKLSRMNFSISWCLKIADLILRFRDVGSDLHIINYMITNFNTEYNNYL